jgi:tRNA(adenine34) deaminase
MMAENDRLWSAFDRHCMDEAIEHAKAASKRGEVPVGAVLAKDGQILAAAGNEVESRGSALGHAEMIVLELASQTLGRHGFGGTALYVTLEPCVLCASALVTCRVESLVFGTRDERFGGCRSIYRITNDFRLNHRLEVREGLAAEICSALLGDFFRHRRLQNSPGSV